MKKAFLSAAAVIVFMLFLPVSALCSDASQQNERDYSADIAENSGAYEVFEGLDNETKELLESLGMDDYSVASMLDIGPRQIITLIIDMSTGKAAKPFATAAVIMGIVLMMSLCDTLMPKLASSAGSVNIVFMLMIALAFLAPVTESVVNTVSAVKLECDFTLTLAPVLAALIASSGNPALAFSYSSLAVGAAEVFMGISSSFLVPVVSAYFAVCVAAGINPIFNIQNSAMFLKKLFTVASGLVAAVFTGLLSFTSLLSKSADSVAVKGVKFLIGGLVPVVGGAMSEGLSAVTGAVKSVSAAVGFAGVAALAVMFIPAACEMLLWWAALWLCSMAATLIGQSSVSFFISGLSNVVVMMNILLCLCTFILICTTGVVVAVGSM